MKWYKALVFAIQMLLRYGPTVWNLAKKIYKEVEEMCSKGVKMTSDQKALAFNTRMSRHLAGKSKRMGSENLNELRENVWGVMNKGKIPKPLTKPALVAPPG
jgi:predicted peroxiredoxin